MTVNKNAFEMLLQAWWGCFGNQWVTAKEIIDLATGEASMRAADREHDIPMFYRWIALRTALDNLAATKISDGDLDSVLDEVKNKIIFNFLIERDGSGAEPLKWRVLLQDKVGMSVEEHDNFRAKFRAKIGEAGFKINPATAEVYKSWGDPSDPYGIENFPPESRTSQKLYWARSPGSDVFVFFHDLPRETRTALRELLEAGRKTINVHIPWIEPAKLGSDQTSTATSDERQI